MATIDVFSQDAFGLIELTGALQRVPFKPQLLGELGLFAPKPIRTVVFGIESKDGVLSIVQSSQRGAPLEQKKKGGRQIRDFRTVRLAKGDRLMASELQGIRAFGTEGEFAQVQEEAMSRLVDLRNDVELTLERHRLGAIQGVVLDADGSVLYDWPSLWGITPAPEINFQLDNPDADVRATIRNVKRKMQKAAGGAWAPSTSVGALVGDNFFDALVNHKQIKETKLGTESAPLLENIPGFSSREIEGVTFINYRGTDDESALAIGTDKAKLFPIGAPDVFQHVMSPGEAFEVVNTPGKPFYALTVPDKDRNMFVDIEVYAYPAMVCTRPGMLLKAKRA